MTRKGFDLLAFVERLRAAQLRVDTRQLMAATELLLTCAERGVDIESSPEALASHLGPIFCTSPEDQALLVRVLRTYLQAAQPSDEKSTSSTTTAERPRNYVPLWTGAAVFVLFVALLSLWLFVPLTLDLRVSKQTATGDLIAAPDALVRLGDADLQPDEEGRVSVTITRASGDMTLNVELSEHEPFEARINADTLSPFEVRLRRSPPRPPSNDSRAVSSLTIGEPVQALSGEVTAALIAAPRPWTSLFAALIVAIATYVLIWIAARMRQHLALQRLSVISDPQQLTIELPHVPWIRLSSQQLRRLVTGLRRRRSDDWLSLNIVATARATAQAGGFVTPVYAPRTAVPEYFVLIERLSEEDHLARAGQEWLQALHAQALAADVYYFRGDPRICHSADGARSHSLAELLSRHSRSTLLLVCESALCFDDIRGTVMPWTAALGVLPRRVLLAPECPYRWTARERQLAREGFVVLPFTAAGLRTLASLEGEFTIDSQFPAPYARPYPQVLSYEPARWLDRNAPEPTVVTSLLRQLQTFLGPSGFTWLCACAVYPEISWPLTRRLATVLVASRSGLQHEDSQDGELASLSRLPWMRYATMPDWLRRALIGQLPKQAKRAVRAHLSQLLDARPSGAAAESRGRIARLGIGRWFSWIDLASAAPSGSPLRDVVFVGFMSQADIDALAVRLPRYLRERIGKVDALPRAVSGRRAQPEKHERAAHNFIARLAAKIVALGMTSPNLVRGIVALGLGGLVFAGMYRTMSTTEARAAFDRTIVVSAVRPMAISDDGGLLAIGDGRRVLLWDMARGAPAGEFATDNVMSLALNPASGSLAVGTLNGESLWDVQTLRRSSDVDGQLQIARRVAFTADGRWFGASGSSNVRVYSFTAEGSRPRMLYRPDFGQTPPFAINGGLVAVAGLSPTPFVQLSRVSDFALLSTFDLEGQAAALALSEDAQLLAVLGESGVVQLFDVRSTLLLSRWTTAPTQGAGQSSITFSPDNTVLTIASETTGDDRGYRVLATAIQMWNWREGRLLHEFVATPNLLVTIRFVSTAEEAPRVRYEVTQRAFVTLPQESRTVDATQANFIALDEVIRPQLVFANGVQRGYRVYPGRRRDLFRVLGLQPGDLVTAVNGYPLTDAARSLDIFNEEFRRDRVVVTLLRSGVPRDIVVNMAQVRSAIDQAQTQTQTQTSPGQSQPRPSTNAPDQQRPQVPAAPRLEAL